MSVKFNEGINIFDLQGKVAAVIGGGGVLAGAMAEALASAGCNIAVLDLSHENAQTRAREIEAYGVQSLALACDVTSKANLQEVCDKILAGLGRVDVLINAAGINSGTPILDIEEKEWQLIMDVNLKGMFLASQVFGEAMIEAGNGGSIINLSSASSTVPLSKVFTYSVSKHGVNGMTKFLAREWAPHNIRVNAIAPGFFPAEQNRKLLTAEREAQIMGHTPMKRYGEAEELGGTTIWLASGKASGFVTGALIRVDGGFMAMTI
jgi:NAD(P)-dependent dehydrogenase (short-subunit alcohol dehydrogenase family)